METSIKTNESPFEIKTGDILKYEYEGLGYVVLLMVLEDRSKAVVVHSDNAGDKPGETWDKHNADLDSLPLFRGEITMKQ